MVEREGRRSTAQLPEVYPFSLSLLHQFKWKSERRVRVREAEIRLVNNITGLSPALSLSTRTRIPAERRRERLQTTTRMAHDVTCNCTHTHTQTMVHHPHKAQLPFVWFARPCHPVTDCKQDPALVALLHTCLRLQERMGVRILHAGASPAESLRDAPPAGYVIHPRHPSHAASA